MATTTNFGWTTPNDTDLVKDGAAAIRTALNGVDTSFVDLKGGTTGQVLAKATNTDLDFSWVAQDDSNAIQNAIVDAKGDLIGATAADTPARLAVGTNGQILTADSTAATGLAWTTLSAGGQTLLSTTTLSGTSTTISSINQGYNQLIIIVAGINLSSTSSAYPTLKPNGTSGGCSIIRQISTGGTPAAQGGNAANIDFNYNLWNSGNANNAFIVTISNYASTSNYKPWSYTGQYLTSDSAIETTNGGGNILTNSAITSLVFESQGPTFNAGTVRIYGVK